MSTPDEQLVRILSEAPEPLFASEIVDRVNREMISRSPCTVPQAVVRMKELSEVIGQLPDGRWTLKSRISR